MLIFFGIGLVVGTLGTLVGVGGGFLLVPLLMFLLPDKSPAQVTAISLFAIACNGVSGVLAQARRGLIHWPSATIFAAASIPGAWWGSTMVRSINPRSFQLLFSGVLLTLGLYLLLRGPRAPERPASPPQPTRGHYILGAIASLGIGFLASFLGIGGGILHVPFLAEVMKFPVHLATGTSQFILSITALGATWQHASAGQLPLDEDFLVPLAVGLVAGAQAGAWLSPRMDGRLILRILAVAVLLVAVQLAWQTVSF